MQANSSLQGALRIWLKLREDYLEKAYWSLFLMIYSWKAIKKQETENGFEGKALLHLQVCGKRQGRTEESTPRAHEHMRLRCFR